jgi:hypothetical protein
VRLAVDAAQPAGVDECGAVEQVAGGEFAEAAHDDDPMVGGEPRPSVTVSPSASSALALASARLSKT